MRGARYLSDPAEQRGRREVGDEPEREDETQEQQTLRPEDGQRVDAEGGDYPIRLERASTLLFSGTALYLVTSAFTRWRLFHTIAVPRLSATVVVLVLFLLAPQVWALLSVALLAVTLVVLNAVESRVLPKTLRQVTEPG